ncbi:MAG: SDR family oxidoreductase [Euryarchaeota archaeon]|nr:SDR family oxidoreductase [Euryarchaeota archaeon]
MDYRLKGNVVLVTGSSLGIGRATALRFAEEGCHIIVTYYQDEQEARETSSLCQRLGAPGAMMLRLDVTDNASIENVVDTIADEMGHLDILVNNAGVIIKKKIEEHSFEDIEKQLRTNLEGTVKITRACLPHLRQMIINVASVTAHRGSPNLGVYAASKGGVIALTHTLVEEIGPRKVYNVYPGATATRMTNFQGDPPEEVAEVIVRLARGDYDVPNGGDVMVRDPPSPRNYRIVRPIRSGPAR